MPGQDEKKVIGVDCPLDSGDNRISQFMCEARTKTGGLYDQIDAGKQYHVIRLLKPTLNDLQQKVNDPSVVFVTASGHGTSDGIGFVRNMSEDLLHSGTGFYDRKAFNHKIVHLFACDTAKNLGPDLVGPDINDLTGASAFFGYNADFSFAQNYAQDPTLAGQFVDCDSAIDLALANGATVQQAFDAAANAFQSLIDKWQLQSDLKALAGLLQQDRKSLSLGIYDPAGAKWTTAS